MTAQEHIIGRFQTTPPKTKTGRPPEPQREGESDDVYQRRLKNREKMRRFRERNPDYFREWNHDNKHRLKRSKPSKEDQRKKGRRRYAERRMWFDDMKRGVPCADCGDVFESCVMDYDHRPGEGKSFCISSRITTFTKERILEEIAKCDLVCARCHRIRTVERIRAEAPPDEELPQKGNAARQRRANRKRRALLDEQKSKPCADCDGKFSPEVMEFDHRPGETKSFNIGSMKRLSIKKLMREIEKCDVVCANCHRLRTHVERAKPEDRV